MPVTAHYQHSPIAEQDIEKRTFSAARELDSYPLVRVLCEIEDCFTFRLVHCGLSPAHQARPYKLASLKLLFGLTVSCAHGLLVRLAHRLLLRHDPIRNEYHLKEQVRWASQRTLSAMLNTRNN